MRLLFHILNPINENPGSALVHWCSRTNTLLTLAGELFISLWDLHKIDGLPIGGLPYEKVVPEFKGLTGVDEKNERFISRTFEFLFLAFQCLHEGESHNLRVTLNKWIKFWCKRVLRYEAAPGGPIIDTPQEHGEEVPIVAKPPVLTAKPNDVQILEDPHQSKLQDSSESVAGPNLKELLLSSKEVISNPCGKVKANIESNFSRQPTRDEKSEEGFATCKSLEKARKKVKKLKAHRDTAKQETAKIESKVLAAEKEFSKCSDVSLAMAKTLKVVEKKK
ncbi:hypothetical protein T459_04728 [Capsicum annuum]|uniref:Aminotransferase-like plant mobile domain-containing protein n=1 Tax=Capsicum annuum TaxID=4072 RepID=A0A2G3A5U9_CAPAN|nr:hypothetical protein T459_04728 [Capsicum annuum]